MGELFNFLWDSLLNQNYIDKYSLEKNAEIDIEM